jgi:RNA polymerase sigma-70 factor, ECF subfamily
MPWTAMTENSESALDHRTLLEQATLGESRALDELLAAYLPRIRAFIRLRMDAAVRARECTADLVQSVCVDLLAKQEGFVYRSDPEFRAWLFHAALHKVNEKQRYHGRQRRDIRREVAADVHASGDPLHDVYQTLGTPSRNIMAQEHMAQIEAAFDQLPDHYRETITLARIAGLPHDEIARRMGKSVGAVRQILGRGLVQLAELLGEDGRVD